MGKYILKRLLLMIPVLLMTSFLIFMCMHLTSGDYISTLEVDEMTEEQMAELRAKYGLDKSLIEQYGIYIYNLIFKGDLGVSYSMHIPVMDVWRQRIGATLYLGVAASIVSIIIALPLGIVAAKRPGTLVDNFSNVLGAVGLATPNFWVGLMLILLFSVKLGWLPSYGNEHWYSVIMPAITIGTGNTAYLMRLTRSMLIEASHQDYCRTAKSKGVSERKVFNKHAMINAGIPVTANCMGLFGLCVSGAALTESVFSWPGVGKVIIDGVATRDTPLVCGLLILKCTIIALWGLLQDITYVFIDPRVKSMYSTKKKGADE